MAPFTKKQYILYHAKVAHLPDRDKVCQRGEQGLYKGNQGCLQFGGGVPCRPLGFLQVFGFETVQEYSSSKTCFAFGLDCLLFI